MFFLSTTVYQSLWLCLFLSVFYSTEGVGKQQKENQSIITHILSQNHQIFQFGYKLYLVFKTIYLLHVKLASDIASESMLFVKSKSKV